MPLWLALSAVVGIFIGTFYAGHFAGKRLSIINSGSNKLTDLLHIVSDQYVDTVNVGDLVEKAVPTILSELDPHSMYISAKDVQTANDDLRGSFSGVGIEFTIRQDTIRVQNVIKNGPAERAGLMAGDKIVTVDGDNFVGKQVTNEEAMHRLKGPKDTKVQLGVLRNKEKQLRHFTVTRAEIPTHSITAAYMLDSHTGYIKVKNFGENTYPEMIIALARLAQQDFRQLVIDLRGNTGGLLMASVQMANEFLPRGKTIVYTEGRKSPRQYYKSDGRGSYKTLPLIVLIDESSASASEIFAGAIQDNDRGTIIGRRSFGKGLVQQPIDLGDGSIIRLTIARYYTPAGRCIQKPYTSGADPDYNDDLVARYEHGEYFTQDSIRHDGPEYHTSNGRVVYGGGGITPDIFVGEDTVGITSYYKEAAITGLILQFAYNYTDDNRQQLNSYDTVEELEQYLRRQNLVELFATFADKNGLKRRNLMIQKSHKLLERYLFSRVIYNMLDEESWTKYLNRDDQAVKQALHIMNAGKAFPQKPTENLSRR